MKRIPRILQAVTIVLGLAVAGCSDDDPAGPNGGGAPPDLSGTYDLASFTSVLTGGLTLTPPIVSGTFTLTQTNVAGDEATGSLTVSITVPDGTGGTQTINDGGTFKVRGDGTWEQTGNAVQGTGTFTLVGSTLTVNVTSPATAVSTSVWQRQ